MANDADALSPAALMGAVTPAALAKRSAPEPIRQALHEHLRAIVDKPLTTRTLLELEQAASLAGKLLVVSGDPRAMALPRRGGMGNMGYIGGPEFGDVLGPVDLDAPPGGGPLAPAALGMGENFGAETIRNMIADMHKPKLSDTMRALDDAEHLLDRAKTPESKAFYEKLVTKLRAQAEELTGGDEPSDLLLAAAAAGNVLGEPCLDCESNLSEHGKVCPKHEKAA